MPKKHTYYPKHPKPGPASGGGGEGLPSLSMAQRAGKSSISQLSNLLPRVTIGQDGQPEFPPGKGPPNLQQLEPIPYPTAVRTGSLLIWGGNYHQQGSQDSPRPHQYERSNKAEKGNEAFEAQGGAQAMTRSHAQRESGAHADMEIHDENNGENRQYGRDYQAEIALLEQARRESEEREEFRAKREGREPRVWSSSPEDIVPIMTNNRPVDPEAMRTAWTE
ncbi:hypothetical protein F5Y19DRAFT_83954 [Xylariaceae sp. FL1651]|nr:hypothetical protein F5Y19DRAFT_83954 [Xylariaceae sp. FL1651]